MASPASAATSRETHTLDGVTWTAYETITNVSGGCSGEVDAYWSGPGAVDSIESRAFKSATEPISESGQFLQSVGTHYVKYYTIPGDPLSCAGAPRGVTHRTLFRNADAASAVRTLHAMRASQPPKDDHSSVTWAILFAVAGLGLSVTIVAYGSIVLGMSAATLLTIASCVAGAGGGAVVAELTGKSTWQRLAVGAVAGCVAGLSGAVVARLVAYLPSIAASVSSAIRSYSPGAAQVTDDVLAGHL